MKHKHTIRRSHSITFGLLLVLAIGAGLLMRHTLASKTPQTDVSFDELFQTVRQDIGSQFSDYTVHVQDWNPMNTDPEAQYIAGYGFGLAKSAQPYLFVTPAKSAAIYDVPPPTKSPRDVADAMANVLRREGFTENERDPHTPSPWPRIFTRSIDECTINSQAYSSVSLQCSSPSLRKQQAAAAQPFADAYLAKNPTLKAKDITFGQLTIKSKNNSGVVTASATAGYDLAEAFIYRTDQKDEEPSIALYYQKNGTWHFITAAKDEYGFSCEDIMADPNARKAYYDQICYDHTLQGQRRMDTARRATQ